MELHQANYIALHALRAIFAAGRPFETDVAGRTVEVGVSRDTELNNESRIDRGFLADGEDWPPVIVCECKWEGGQCSFVLSVQSWRNQVGLSARIAPRRRGILWSSIGTPLQAASGDEPVTIGAAYSRRTMNESGEARKAELKMQAQLKRLVSSSGMPLLKKSVELFRIQPSDGAVLPTPQEAFERILRLVLYKVDFLAWRVKERERRGAPLIDLVVDPSILSAEVDDDGSDEEDSSRQYWAADVAVDGQASRRDEFSSGSFWELGVRGPARDASLATAWRRLDKIEVGDGFALKEVEDEGSLKVLSVGRVTSVDTHAGRIEFAAESSELFQGPATFGSAGGDWSGTLLRVEQDADITLLFGDQVGVGGTPGEEAELQLNLILYGPPGTGKTYEIRESLMPAFRAPSSTGTSAIDVEALDALPWYQVVGAALHDLGQPATVPELREHRWVKAKAAIQQTKTPLGSRLWSALQVHTVDTSATVGLTSRAGERVFDKDGESRWRLINPESSSIPGAVAALAAPSSVAERFRFVTFHQSYGYEDFIEGIRPKTLESGEGEGRLTYELEDGVFMRAVREALRLTGFEGSIHEFCSDLTQEERADYLVNAPRFAVFVDEINRGNVARIFGELITLIEPTRRLGAAEELIATLPASGTRFGVPSNLHLVGTMNTADRSVEALDTALRRRFAFRECPPRPELLDDVIVDGNIDVAALLRVMNRRLLKLLDRDHLIGHAYFMPLREDQSFDRLQGIFRDAILPLLQEYFYGDWGRIGLVLGRAFVRRHGDTDVQFAHFSHEDSDALAERTTFELVDLDSVTNENFRSIYIHGSTDT